MYMGSFCKINKETQVLKMRKLKRTAKAEWDLLSSGPYVSVTFKAETPDLKSILTQSLLVVNLFSRLPLKHNAKPHHPEGYSTYSNESRGYFTSADLVALLYGYTESFDNLEFI